MNETRFKAMGTDWWVHADLPGLADAAPAAVEAIEACLSRFRPDSSLSRLNRERSVTDPLLAEVTRQAIRIAQLTAGAFDPTLGADLVGLGYDRSFDALGGSVTVVAPPQPRLHLALLGGTVTLDGPGLLDLGGIGKGWAVDHVLQLLLDRGAAEVLVDGGGDIRGAGRAWPVGVGDDLIADAGQHAVATSSTQRRRWRTIDGSWQHHILDPKTRRPASAAIDTATVTAPTAALADALATAVLVDPDGLLPRLAELGATAAVRGLDGQWWTTSDWSTDA